MASSACLLAVVTATAWVLLSGVGQTDSVAAAPAELNDYNNWIKSLNVGERDFRDELNHLAMATKVPLEKADQVRVLALKPDCEDPKLLLQIGFIGKLIRDGATNRANPFAFVTSEQQAELEALAGQKPSAETVLKIRRELVFFAHEFDVLRQAPDWKVEVSGEEKVALPLLDMLREAFEFMPAIQHPNLRDKPVIPVFSPAEGELLIQLRQYFNGARAKEAFPSSAYPNAYLDRKLPAIPRGLSEYRRQINRAITAEKKIILPDVKGARPDHIEAVDEIYRRLERFLDAIEQFEK